MGFKKIDATEIEQSLVEKTRQYLLGHLKMPQVLTHIDDLDLEIGITDYKNFAREEAHTHACAKEYQYVLCGMTEYMDTTTEEVHRFRTGDFFVIYPGTNYIQRAKAGTRILFVKYPAGNDKSNILVSEDIDAWSKDVLRVERVDLEGEFAPPANSVKPAAAAAILNSKKQLLMIKRRDSGNWTMPGGTMELNESLKDCILREVYEETGLMIRVEGVVGTYTNPETKIVYSDGEVRREFSIVFFATPDVEHVVLDDESTAWKWVPISDLGGLPMATSQKRRVQDVIEYISVGRSSVR